MSTIIKSGIKRVNVGKWGNLFRYYQSELTVTGKHPNRKFSIDLFSSESKDMGVAVQIGTIDPKTGALTLNPEPADPPHDRERQYKTKIALATKLSGTYWEGKIGDEGLKELSNEEKEKLGIASGNNNQSTDNDNSNDDDDDGGPGGEAGEGGGKNGTKADFNFDIDKINSDLTNINIEGRQFRDTYKNLYYPEGLGSNRQDRIRFTQKYTQGRKVNISFDANTKIFQRDPEIKIDGSVTLPIVTGIGDRNAVDWRDESLNPIQALAAGGAVTVFDKIKDVGIKEAFKEVEGIVQSAQGEFRKNQKVGSDMAKAINVYLAQQAVGAQGLLSRATGAILNPNLEMLFGGPKLRSFGFTFRLSPRDASEASQVRQIIRFFKQGMSVKTSSSNVFLKTPNVFDIQYQTYNTDGTLIEHPSINFIKTCALTSCDVQYTPDGTYMTYEDPYRTLTSYQLTLNFGELDPIFDDDYTELDDDDDTVIGY